MEICENALGHLLVVCDVFEMTDLLFLGGMTPSLWLCFHSADLATPTNGSHNRVSENLVIVL